MCGIVGYIGHKDAFPILIKGLRRLEYRGYDSAGVALVNDDGELNVYKTKGKVDDLVNYCSDKNVSGVVGIAHTRWATHGEPSSLNAHPHYSRSKNLAIIHNGIIENYSQLRSHLQAKGIRFVSDTDTEVLVQLIEYIQEKKNIDLLTAVQLALHEAIGAYAIAILDYRHPDTLIAARNQSPLVVGIGNDEYFIASDASPIVEYTDKVVYLEDGNIAVIKQGKELEIVNNHNRKIHPEIQTVDINLGSAKGWAGGILWNEKAKETIERFYARPDTLSLGICNGCQVMIELNLINPEYSSCPRMEHNNSHKFESDFLGVTIPQNKSVMFGSLSGSKLGIWVAHGEGIFFDFRPLLRVVVLQSVLDHLAEQVCAVALARA